MTRTLMTAGLAALAFQGVAFAQPAKFQVAEPAELLKVEDGVFALDLNQAIDITDQHLLMALVRKQGECLSIVVRGDHACIELGQRFDFKDGAFWVADKFADREECFLDVVKIDDVKGVDPRVTFRLYCV